MAEQNDARDSGEERVVNPVDDGFHYEDEHGSITVHKKDLQKLDIRNGDVIKVKRFKGLTTQAITWLAEELGLRGYGDCIVVVVDKMSDIKALNEELMRKYNWIKLDRLGYMEEKEMAGYGWYRKDE